MFELLDKIAQANEFEIESLMKAVQQRYNVLFPDWEIVTVSLQKNADPNKQLDQMITLLQQLKSRD